MYSEATSPPVQSPTSAARSGSASRRLLVGLLVAASAVVDAAFLGDPVRFPAVSTAVFFGILLGQLALAAGWMVMGRRFWLLRLAAFLASSGAAAVLLSPRIAPNTAECFGFLLGYAACVVTPLLALRFAGLRVGAIDRASLLNEPQAATWRYSLAALFAVTTGTAIVAASLRAASFPVGPVLVVLAYLAGFAAMSLIALAPLALRRRFWIGILLTLLAAPGLGAAIGALEGMSGQIACLVLSQAAYLCVAVTVLRLAGYRAVWGKSLA